MEATLDLDVLSKSPTREIVAEETTEELDNILNEVVNMAKTLEDQKPGLDNIVPDGEEAVDETNFPMQPGETLELEIDLPREATESQVKKTPLAEETKSAFDALIGAENEVMDSLAKEAAANDAQDASSTVTGKDSESKDSEKSLAEDLNTRAEAFCDGPVKNTVAEETSDKFPADNEESSKDSLDSRDSDNEVEDVSAPVGETSILQGSADQLADVLSKKIEMTVSRLIEKELSVLVERIVTNKIKGILANIR
jgi:hypothetical protein